MSAQYGYAPTRREVLAALASLAGLGLTDGALPQLQTVVPSILPRSFWAEGLPDPGDIDTEDVRFLLVHHTGSPGSDYASEDVISLLRSIHSFHTGPEKQWPDIAYNFFVDRFGRIIEARAGSIEGAIQGSATGGNQGYSQLCCFLGDMSSEPPTSEALASMSWLLGWLANKHGLDLTPGATTTFASRGSNRWPEGSIVETTIIAGHRDMSLTECPGDACYEILQTDIAEEARRREVSLTSTTTTTSIAPLSQSTATSVAPSSSSTPAPPTTSAPTTTTPEGALGSIGVSSEAALEQQQPMPNRTTPALVVSVVGLCLAGMLALRERARRSIEPDIRKEFLE